MGEERICSISIKIQINTTKATYAQEFEDIESAIEFFKESMDTIKQP